MGWFFIDFFVLALFMVMAIASGHMTGLIFYGFVRVLWVGYSILERLK